jgi:hypothetical protein
MMGFSGKCGASALRKNYEPCEMKIAEQMGRGQHRSAPVLRRPQQGASCNECLRRSGAPSRSGNGRASPRSAETIRCPRPNGFGLRRGEGKFGLRKDIGRDVALGGKLAMLPKPAGQKGFGHFGNPLLEQCADFFAQIGGVIQARELEAFERSARCFAQIVPRRNNAAISHNWNPPSEPPLNGTISTIYIGTQDNSNRFTVPLWKSL